MCKVICIVKQRDIEKAEPLSRLGFRPDSIISAAVMQGALTGAEESKVKLGEPDCSSGDLNKRGATRVARWLYSVFKEQACPQSGEASLVLEIRRA
jgi:hypothetical protein